ncbi:MAG: 4-hydroxy-tetrahydrodipicolinate reductase [Actinobacteria bacterium]|nr:4-hydroxy-tetrahydrodipicolinate reductase [Actinomycetota bacterium]
MKRIAILGICGNMGSAITGELLKEKDVEIIGGFDRVHTGQDIGLYLGINASGSRIYGSLADIKELNPDLAIDFTNAGISLKSIDWAIDNSIDIIVGTTGFKKDELKLIEEKANSAKSRVFIVPNFSIGAVLMMELSAIAAKYFESCEIIELHHNKKKDAPSGTALLTAEKIYSVKKFTGQRLGSEEKETIEGSRGAFAEGVHIHSLRLKGLLAHQEVIFGTTGQTLTIRHDTLDRLSFYPGVILAVRAIDSLDNFTYGLDKIIDIKGGGK